MHCLTLSSHGPIQQAGHVHKSEDAPVVALEGASDRRRPRPGAPVSSRRHYRTPGWEQTRRKAEAFRYIISSWGKQEQGGREKRLAFFGMALLRVCRRRPALFLAGASGSQGSFEGRRVLSGA
jgi:hypothetical protein